MRVKREQAAPLLNTIAVWGLYLSFYLAIFATLIIGVYALAQRIILEG